MNLFDLGLKYNTDKSSYHGFTKVYDKELSLFKEKNIKFLEIGILRGSSLKMWEEYFSKATIYGLDVENKKIFETKRITTLLGSQENINDLEKLPSDLDVVLDDGGHTMKQQQISLKYIFSEKLKSKGIYILEDLQTSLETYYNTKFGGNEKNNTLKLLEDFKSKKLSENNEYYISENEFNHILNMIDSVEIYRLGTDSITSIIKKK